MSGEDFLQDLVAGALESAQAIDDTVALFAPSNQIVYNPDEFATLGDCDFGVDDPFLILRIVLGHEGAQAIQDSGDLPLVAASLRKWAHRIQGVLNRKNPCLQGAQQGQRQEL